MRSIFFLVLLFAGVLAPAQNINLSQGLYFDGEPYLSADPGNPRHMVVAWMGFIPFQQVAIRTMASFDGGKTWSQATSTPHSSQAFTSADPSMAWDASGNINNIHKNFLL